MSGYDPVTSIPRLGSVALELTNHCNLSCGICWSQNPVLYPPREKGYMDPDLFKKIIDEIVSDHENDSDRKTWLSLSYGGESLMHPDFDELLEYAAKTRFFDLQLITNGILLPEHLTALLKHRVRITVSYHHHTPDMKTNVDRNIENLLIRRGHTPVNVAVVDAEAPGLYAEARNKFGACTYNYPMITEDLKYVDDRIEPLPAFCRFPFVNMAVLWNGDVWPCCRLLSSDFPSLGNLHELSTMEVWDGPAYINLRLHPEQYPCKHCEVY